MGPIRTDRLIAFGALVSTSAIEFRLFGLLGYLFTDVPVDPGPWIGSLRIIYLPAIVAGGLAALLNESIGIVVFFAVSSAITFGLLLLLGLCIKRAVRLISPP
jgi:hypothetical protein